MTPPRVLICDDDRTGSLILKHLLTKAGYEVSLAANGKEGLIMAGTFHPDVLILDLDMPVKNGFQVLEELSASSEKPEIIVLSAHESLQDHERVRKLGATDMMIKPFRPSELIERVHGLTRKGNHP